LDEPVSQTLTEKKPLAGELYRNQRLDGMIFYILLKPFPCLTLILRMMKKILCGAAAIILYLFVFAQADSLRITGNDTLQVPDTSTPKTSLTTTSTRQQVYKLKPVADIPVFAVGASWSGYAFTKIYSKDTSTIEEVLSLDVNDINGFDRLGSTSLF
jgi:hypothetical protein